MSYNLTPITARVQKNSKGGVTEPYIKGIGVAKMKGSYVAEKIKDISKRVSKKLTKAAKAVDEGRDKKADRLYKRAARIENREIRKSEKK